MYRDGGFADGYLLGANNNNGGFGADGGWAWWIIILLIFGYGGFGFGNGLNGNGGANMTGYELGKLATTNDLAAGFANNAVIGSLNDLQLGQAGINQTLCQGFNGVNTTILTSVNGLQSQIADCCCQTQRAIDGINYNMAKNTCDIIRSNQDSTQRIIDYMTSEKINSLQAENSALLNQLSQANQTSNIISALRPIPTPAFVVPNPFAPTPTTTTTTTPAS